MRTLITYFSGTGNSYFIAKKLSESLIDNTVVSITKIIRDNLSFSDYHQLVIIYPVYYVGLPLIVENFIKFFNFEQYSNIYYICTSGDSDGLNCSTRKISRILKKQRKTLTGGFNISLPGNYILMYDSDNQEIINSKFQNALIKINQIAEIINSGKESIKKDKVLPLSLPVNSIWHCTVHTSDKKYFASDNCNGCGICTKICPVNNIVLNNLKPQWNHLCEGCLACIHFCPQKAINTKTTITRERYKNPFILINELIANK